MTEEPRCFSPVAAGFSNYNGEYRLPLVLAQGSPIIHSSCEGEMGIALESMQDKKDFNDPDSHDGMITHREPGNPEYSWKN